ncbi:MAG: hypothetical protein ABR542_04765 [Desulfonatronovibrio sp.]
MMKKILFFIILIMIPASAYSWQQVSVEKHIDEEDSSKDVRDMVLDKGFRRAIGLEIDRLIPGKLSIERSSALMNHLQGRVEDLVQGYRRTQWHQDDTVMGLDMEVDINVQLLREILQESGVYYTSLTPLHYSLSTKGISLDAFSDLQRFQLITGVTSDSEAPTRLTIAYTPEKAWTGEIEHEQINLSVSGSELEDVWFDLWGYFFSRPDIVSIFVKEITLDTTGWPTIDYVRSFDSILMDWNEEVEKSEIVSIFTDIPSLMVTWNISTLNRDILIRRLDHFFDAREMSYNIR